MCSWSCLTLPQVLVVVFLRVIRYHILALDSTLEIKLEKHVVSSNVYNDSSKLLLLYLISDRVCFK